MIALRAGDLDKYLRLEQPVPDETLDGAGSGAWVLVDEIWANVQDVLPSRGESTAGGMTATTRRARVRIYWRDDVDASMRLVLGTRIMQIVSETAELGRRAGLEFMVEDYRPAGNPA